MILWHIDRYKHFKIPFGVVVSKVDKSCVITVAGSEVVVILSFVEVVLVEAINTKVIS